MVGAFTYVDLAFLAITLIALIVGLCKGFFSQLFGFIGFFAAILVAFFVCKPVTELVKPAFAPLYEKVGETLGYYASLIIVFVVLMLIVNIVLFLIKKLFSGLIGKVAVIKAVDKLLGLVFSLGVVYILFSSIIALLTLLPTDFLPEIQTTVNSQIFGGSVLKPIYANNPFGDWLLSLISNGVTPTV